MTEIVYPKADFYCGLGGMLFGYEQARAERAGVRARFKTTFAVDVWPVAAESCHRMTGFRPTVADLFTWDQYVRFHGPKPCWCSSKKTLEDCHKSPPPDWREMVPADIRRACPDGFEIVEASPPCMANSGLLPSAVAATEPYQVLNDLMWRWLWLILEAFPDKPPRLFIMENVPGVADPRRKKRRRGEDVVERCEALFQAYGYASRRTSFDVGEVCGGPSHRPRFLLVARHVARCQAPLLEPFKLTMGTIGDAIGDLPLPIGETIVPMHTLPKLARRTEERLAFVTSGGDWRSIEGNYKSAEGWTFLSKGGVDLLVPATAAGVVNPTIDRKAFNNVMRMGLWGGQSPCVTTGNTPTAGGITIADPRLDEPAFGDVLGVRAPDQPSGTITAGCSPTRGAFSVADPALTDAPGRHTSKYSVGSFEHAARTVTASSRVGSGAAEVADPRLTCQPNGATLRVVGTDGQAPTITGTEGVWSTGSVQLADPVPTTATLRNGFFGVQGWGESSDTVHGSMDVHCGPAAVEDLRGGGAGAGGGPGRIIIAPDWNLWRTRGEWRPSAWHRALTLRELADLMTLPRLGADGQPLQIAGTQEEIRKQIGNAVPPKAARVFGELFLATLLSTDLGVAVSGGGGIWVREEGVLRWYATSAAVAPEEGEWEGAPA